MEMIATYSFHGLEAGTRLVITGAVHGDETCGTVAVKRLIDDVSAGRILIKQGRLTLVPVCNPRAYQNGVRFIDRNLNRDLVPKEAPQTYEDKIGNILHGLLLENDALLDLHSSPRGNKPYVFVGPYNAKEYAFAASLGVSILMSGWEDIYPSNGTEGIGTEQVMRNDGKIATLVECGIHQDPQAPNVAYRAIIGAMTHLGMIEADANIIPASDPTLIVMRAVYRRTDDGKMARNWEDFSPVKAGETLATRANGEVISAPSDGFVILPHPDCLLNQEWFYFGIR